jgi:nucleoside 2-deoxyribosyltransferase
MKIFLSVSYSSQVDATGKVFPEYRKELESVISVFEKINHHVYCAPREDLWTLNDTSPADAFEVDMRNVNECNLFVAFVGNKVSAGIQMEMGFALAKGKRIIIAIPATDKLGYVNQGLIDTRSAEILVYADSKDLQTKLAELMATSTNTLG